MLLFPFCKIRVKNILYFPNILRRLIMNCKRKRLFLNVGHSILSDGSYTKCICSTYLFFKMLLISFLKDTSFWIVYRNFCPLMSGSKRPFLLVSAVLVWKRSFFSFTESFKTAVASLQVQAEPPTTFETFQQR